MSSVAFIPIVLGLIGLIAAFGIYRAVLQYAPGTGKVTEIGEMIHHGALVFIRREYTYLAIFVAVVAVLAGGSVGRNEGVHQAQRRIHRQHRANRRWGTNARRRAHPGNEHLFRRLRGGGRMAHGQ